MEDGDETRTIDDPELGLGHPMLPRGEIPTVVPVGVEGDVHRRSVFEQLGLGHPRARRRIGRYMILEVLGHGGMGSVFSAYDRELDRAVAIKLLRPGAVDRDARRLKREAQALAKLSHPNVVQVYEVGETEGQTFIAMELIKGQTLANWRRDHQPQWRECVEVYLQAGAGLAAAHARGLVHRDFKPANAVVDEQGQVRVLDFGLVRQAGGAPSEGSEQGSTSLRIEPVGSDASLTETGDVMGTPVYMPLEQLEGLPADARSDQFSFCVSLWEAVYGQRPFEGGSIEELRAELSQGRIATSSSGPRDGSRDGSRGGSRGPAKLRHVLLRGLSREPADRWPSMEALLGELRRLVAPRRRGMTALGLGLLGGLGMLGAGLAYRAEVGQRCQGAQAQLDGVWDDDVRRVVEDVVVGTRLPYAVDTWERVEARLDEYAETWVTKHTEVCEATAIRRRQSEEVMDLRMGCLGERRVALHAAVKLLLKADAEVVENGVGLVADLPELFRCDDVAMLRQARQLVPPPEDPAVIPEVETQRERLADVDALREAGKYSKAMAWAELVVQRAQELGYRPLLAEARLRRGQLRDESGQYPEAEEDLAYAHALAAECRHEDVEFEAARALAYVVGSRQVRYAEGLLWGQLAVPLAKRSGDTQDLAMIEDRLGAVLQAQGKFEEAEAHHRRALEIWQDVQGVDHPRAATTLNNLGAALSRLGRYDEAESQYRRALETRERLLGKEHPYVADSLSSLGVLYSRREQPEEAEGYFRRALTLRERALGEEHPHVAISVNNLGSILETQGKHEDAAAQHRRALAIWEKTVGDDHPNAAMSMGNLGNVLSSLGRYDEAESYHRQALQIRQNSMDDAHPDLVMNMINLGVVLDNQHRYKEAEGYFRQAQEIQQRTLGAEHPTMGSIAIGLGRALGGQGKHEEAELQFRQALALHERVYGPEHAGVAKCLYNLGNALNGQGRAQEANELHLRVLGMRERLFGVDDLQVAYPLVRLAEIDLARNALDAARASAERAVSIRDEGGAEPALLAEARFLLARVLWESRVERKRARQVAQEALVDYTRASGGNRDEVAEVEQWLAEHRM